MKFFLSTFHLALICFGIQPLLGQNTSADDDAFMIRSIYDQILTDSKCFDWLTTLSENIGGRISGSPQAAAAVEYTKRELEGLGLDSVWLQPCEVPHWVRGNTEIVRVVSSNSLGTRDLHATTLGNSTGSGPEGVRGEVIEVHSLDEARELGNDLAGKIVFFNRPMDPTQIRTFMAYGGAADQRVRGPATVAEFGAVGCIVRSLTTQQDDVPHTGTTVFQPDERKIPAMAISTNDANLLSRTLKKEAVTIYMENEAQMLDPVESYNVIGEIKGSEFPDEIIVIGGHLDSWDLGGGAHDDGAGCVHAMEVLNAIKNMNYIPKRTIRCVLFMNEENGLGGGRAYAEIAEALNERHIVAIESDAGGFTPRGFSCDGVPGLLEKGLQQLTDWLPLLEPYGLGVSAGGSGADISPLKPQEVFLLGFRPDSQRYFDYHHTKNDKIDVVNARELQLGAASITTLVYLFDQYGLQ